MLYRLIVIPRTRRIAGELEKEASWTGSRPATGPGRVDTFNHYQVMVGLDVKRELSVGTADLPSLWNQGMREGMWLHWDGNNDLVTERNKSAAIGAGCSEESLDLSSMKRVEEWIRTLPAPAFPSERRRSESAAEGAAVYKKACADCHEKGGSGTGKVVPLAEIGTDPERLNSFTAELAAKMNTLGRDAAGWGVAAGSGSA